MARKTKLPVIPVALPAPTKPRGVPGAPQLRPHHFKKGQSGNPGGKPKIFMTFDAMVRRRLMEPCPALIAKQLGLRRGATNYDAIVAAQVLSAASGDNASFMALHDLVEGRLPQRNLNLSVSAEQFLQDEGFRNYLQQQHGAYLHGQSAGSLIDAPVPDLPAEEDET